MKPNLLKGYEEIIPKNNNNFAWDLYQYSEAYKMQLVSGRIYKIIFEGQANAPIFGIDTYFRSILILEQQTDLILQLLINPDWDIEQIKNEFELC